jgi:hypothetical protein
VINSNDYGTVGQEVILPQDEYVRSFINQDLSGVSTAMANQTGFLPMRSNQQPMFINDSDGSLVGMLSQVSHQAPDYAHGTPVLSPNKIHYYLP